MYAFTTQTSEVSVKARSSRIDGRATFTIVVSRTIIRSPRQRTISASQRLRLLSHVAVRVFLLSFAVRYYFFFPISISRKRSTATPGAKSSSSKNCRTSISASLPSVEGLGKRRAHSFASAKGPSTTVRLLPEYLTRQPLELGFKPDASSSTPAFCSSSWYFCISDIRFSEGITSPSESFVALTIIMNRILFSDVWEAGLRTVPVG